MGKIFKESFVAIWATILGTICLVIFITALFGVNTFLEPLGLKAEREAVLQSQGYVDGSISGLETYKTEYARLEVKLAEAGNNKPLIAAYQAQQKAMLESICHMVAKMQSETVPTDVTNFIKTEGGCK